MNEDIIVELMFFLISILWGAIILLAYDSLRILRRLIKHKTLLVGIEDLIFWVIASIFIFSMIYRENDGIIRGFSIIGMALGMVVYHYIMSDFIVKLFTKIIQSLLKPFGFILRKIKKAVLYLMNFVSIRLKRLFKSVRIGLNNRIEKKKTKRYIKKSAKLELKRAKAETKKKSREIKKANGKKNNNEIKISNAKKRVELEKIQL